MIWLTFSQWCRMASSVGSAVSGLGIVLWDNTLMVGGAALSFAVCGLWSRDIKERMSDEQT